MTTADLRVLTPRRHRQTVRRLSITPHLPYTPACLVELERAEGTGLATVALASYAVRVKTKYSQAQVDELLGAVGRGRKDTPDAGIDAYGVVESFLRDWLNANSDDEEEQRLIEVKKLECTPSERVIEGIVASGEYGFESTIVDRRTREVAHVRTKDHAELLPFYFYLWLPQSGRKGLVFLQRFRGYGMTSTFNRALRTYAGTELSGYTVHIEPHVPTSLWERYLADGGITQMTFVKRQVPPDLIDRYGGKGAGQEVRGTSRLVIVPEKGKFLQLRNILSTASGASQDELRGMMTIEGVEYEDATVQLAIGGSKRTLSLGTLTGSRGYVDVDDEVELENGLPTYESLKAAARRLAGEIRQEMGTQQ